MIPRAFHDDERVRFAPFSEHIFAQRPPESKGASGRSCAPRHRSPSRLQEDLARVAATTTLPVDIDTTAVDATLVSLLTSYMGIVGRWRAPKSASAVLLWAWSLRRSLWKGRI